MWNKALWYREYRQARWLIWVFPIAHFFMLGLQRLNTWILDKPNQIQARIEILEDGSSYPFHYYELTTVEEAGTRFLLTILLLLLAMMLMGGERRNGVQEFLFSLPYSRRTLFAVKWLLGIVLLTGSIIVNHLLDILIVWSSPIGSYLDIRFHLDQAIYSWIFLAMIYAFGLFIGAFCGSLASQSVVSLLLFILPTMVLLLIRHLLYLHHVLIAIRHWEFMEDLNLLSFMFLRYHFFAGSHFLILGLLLAVATATGGWIYMRNRTENNGKLMLFPIGERILQVGFVLVFSLCCGSTLSTIMLNQERLWYYAGFLVGLVLGSWIMIRLSRMRLKI